MGQATTYYYKLYMIAPGGRLRIEDVAMDTLALSNTQNSYF